MVNFLSRMFRGRKITSKACEGTFGNMGRRAKGGNRVMVILRKSYRITYLDHDTVKTERRIEVIERKGKCSTCTGPRYICTA